MLCKKNRTDYFLDVRPIQVNTLRHNKTNKTYICAVSLNIMILNITKKNILTSFTFWFSCYVRVPVNNFTIISPIHFIFKLSVKNSFALSFGLVLRWWWSPLSTILQLILTVSFIGGGLTDSQYDIMLYRVYLVIIRNWTHNISGDRH